MSYYKQRRIGERLNFAKEFIALIETDPVISERMGQFNYSTERLAEGRALIAAAVRVDLDRRVKIGQQTAATGALNDLLHEMRLTFNSDRKIARTLLRNDKQMAGELRLVIATDTNRAVFLQQARHFYEQVFAHESVKNLFLTYFNITPEVFDGRMQNLEALESAMQVQQERIGEARVATQVRRNAMKELDNWMAAAILVARQVFKDDKSWLVKLGIEQSRKKKVETEG